MRGREGKREKKENEEEERGRLKKSGQERKISLTLFTFNKPEGKYKQKEVAKQTRMVLDFNNKVTYLFLVPMNEDIFLYEHFPPHVSLVE